MTKMSSIPAVRALVNIAHLKGIRHVVSSPGSRNAPIILSFKALDDFSVMSVLDERSAGFIALGKAQQLNEPVILTCTSGSAVVNYAPALVEAYYQRIPLVAITADRPKAWIDQGEGQSIRQEHLLDNVLISSFNLVEVKDDTDAWYNQRLINEAFETARIKRRPVQINVPLSEPLYDLAELEDRPHSFSISESLKSPSDELRMQLKEHWSGAKRIMILVTQGGERGLDPELLRLISEDSRVAVFTESTANLYQLGFISCIDRTIDGVIGQDAYVPDLLVTLGGNVISKKLKAWFRNHKASLNHIHLGDQVMDTFQSLKMVVDADVNEVFRVFLSSQQAETSDFGQRWKSVFFRTEELHKQFIAQSEYSDLKVFDRILDYLPEGSKLQMGNSSVVRYIQLFNQLRGVSYYGNRGVSGIEGCTSTAVGAALSTSDTLNVFISGDQSFRYDSNGLAHAGECSNLRIIVINNGGGNIFRIIEGPNKHEEISKGFIEKVDEAPIQKLVEYHGLIYHSARTMDELDSALKTMMDASSSEAQVLEIFTPRVESPDILKEYFSALKG